MDFGFGGTVPLEVRRKLQLLLLVRHSSLGCPLSKMQDEYAVYYKEHIFPEMFTFNNWEALLKAVPEVDVKRSRGRKVVFGKELTHDFTKEMMARVFPKENPPVHNADQGGNIPKEPEPVVLDPIVEDLIQMGVHAVSADGSDDLVGNGRGGDNRQDNVSSSSPDFAEVLPVTFERIPKVEVVDPYTPSDPSVPVLAAADSGSQCDPADGEEDVNGFEESVEEKYDPAFHASGEAYGENNGDGGSAEGNEDTGVPESHSEDQQSPGNVEGGPNAEETAKEEDSDDDIEVVYEALNDREASPAVKAENGVAGAFSSIPRKCTFRARGEQPERVDLRSRHQRICRLEPFKARFIASQNTVYSNQSSITLTAPNEAENRHPPTDEPRVKVEVKIEASADTKPAVEDTVEDSNQLESHVKPKEEGTPDGKESTVDVICSSADDVSDDVPMDTSESADLVESPDIRSANACETPAAVPTLSPDESHMDSSESPPGLSDVEDNQLKAASTPDAAMLESVRGDDTTEQGTSAESIAAAASKDCFSGGTKSKASSDSNSYGLFCNPVSETVTDAFGSIAPSAPMAERGEAHPGVTADNVYSDDSVDSSSSSQDSSDSCSSSSDSCSNTSFSDCDLWGPSNIFRLAKDNSMESCQTDTSSGQKRKKTNNKSPKAKIRPSFSSRGTPDPSKGTSSTSKSTPIVNRTSPRPKRVIPPKQPAEVSSKRRAETLPYCAPRQPAKRKKGETPGTSKSGNHSRPSGSKTTAASAQPMITDLVWFKPASSKLTGFEDHLYMNLEGPESAEPFIDRRASNTYVEVEGYGFNVDVETLRDIRNNKSANILCYHKFWSLTSQCKKTDFSQLWKDDLAIPNLSFDAIQLVNLDANMNYSLSSKHTNGELRFVSSYGNFEEYFMWRTGNKCKGFGLMPTSLSAGESSRSSDVFRNNFFPFSDDGEVDILDPSSKAKFLEFVQSNSPSLEVDVFVANGIGLPSAVYRAQDLCLAQFLLALQLLREGGDFVLKLEDTLTFFGVGLIFLMSRCFGQIAIYKPVSAFPGERFIICTDKRSAGVVKVIRDFLNECYECIVENCWSQKVDEISGMFRDDSKGVFTTLDDKFLEYVKLRNNAIATAEWDEWDDFLKKSKLVTTRKEKECILLELAEDRNRIWKMWSEISPLDVIVNNICLKYEGSKPELYWRSIFGNNADAGILERPEKSVTTAVKGYKTPVGHISQWKFVPSSGVNNRFILLACKNAVYKYENKSWKEVPDLLLTQGTVLYGELIQRGPPCRVLNIIDAAMIGHDDIRQWSLSERRVACKRFAMDMDAPVNLDYRVICSDMMRLIDLPAFLIDIHEHKGKFEVLDSSNQLMDTVSSKDAYCTKQNLVWFKASEVLLVKSGRAPESCDDAGGSNAGSSDFGFLMRNRYFWEWNPRSGLMATAEAACGEIQNAEDFATALFEYLADTAKN